MGGTEVAGTRKVLALGSAARLSSFRHDHGRPHVDPDEEAAPRPMLIFTVAGIWGLRTARGRFDVTPQKIVLLNAGEAYRCEHDSPFPCDRTVYVEIDRHDGFTFGRAWLPYSPGWGSLLKQMAYEERARPPGHRLAIDALAARLVVGVARLDRERPAEPAAVDAARAFLDLSFREDVGLKDVAAAASTSPFHLVREFKRHVGQTPRQYLIERRIGEAKVLLRDTGRSVTQVAHACGFNSVSHFSTTFRARTGVTPSAFRRDPPAERGMRRE